MRLSFGRRLLRGTLALTFAAFAGISLAQPTWIAGDDAVQGAASDQAAPDISFSGSSFLVVWSDNRSNPLFSYEYETSRDIYGLRLDMFGNPIQTFAFDAEADVAQPALASFPIYQGKGAQNNPTVAWNGSAWLVVFENVQNNGTGYYDTGLMAVRVSGEGQVLDRKPIPFHGLKQNGFGYTLGTDGTSWVLVNQGNAASGNIVAMRIAPNGQVLDPPTRTIIAQTYYQRTGFQLAYAQGVFMLLCSGEYLGGMSATDVTRFDSNLNVLSGPTQSFNGPTYGILSNGSQFLVYRLEQLPNFTMAVTATRMTPGGQKLDVNGINISLNNEPTGALSGVWDGANYKLIWQTSAGYRAARVASNGTVLEPGGVGVPSMQVGPMASNGTGGITSTFAKQAVWNNDIFTQFLSSANAVGQEMAVSVSSPAHTMSDWAGNANGAILVYRSTTSSTVSIMAQRLNASGVQLGAPVTVVTASPPSQLSYPHIAVSGSTYLATWATTGGVYAQRLNESAQPIGPAQLIAPSHFGPADVDAQNGVFLVSTRRFGINPQYITAYATRVRASDGALLDASPFVLGGGYVSRPPVVAAHNGGWLVAFLSNWTHDESNASSVLTFVPPSGTGLTSISPHIFSTAGGNGYFEMGLASSGTTALFVIPQELTSGVENDLRAQMITGSLALGTSFNITPWSGNQYHPRVAWNGAHFVVAYQDQRTRLLGDAIEQLDARSDLFGMRIGPNGTILDPQGFAISANDTAETDPHVMALGGRTMFVASLMNSSSFLSSYRLATTAFGASGNHWPVARLQASPSSGDIPLAVSFNSAGSLDPDGGPVTFSWSFGDGGTSSQAAPVHVYTTPGPHRVRLFVRDATGQTTQQTTTIDATAANVPPIAAISNLPASGQAPLHIEPSAENSYDPDGQLGNIQWTIDGYETWGPTGYYTFSTPGTYQVSVKVWDNRGATTTVMRNVVVTP